MKMVALFFSFLLQLILYKTTQGQSRISASVTSSAFEDDTIDTTQHQAVSQAITFAINQESASVADLLMEEASSEDVAVAFGSMVEQGDAENLAEFVNQHIGMDSQGSYTSIQIVHGLEAMVDRGECEQVISIFKEIDAFIMDDVILMKLQEALLDSQSIQVCIATVVTSTPTPPPISIIVPPTATQAATQGASAQAAGAVPPQDSCYEGSTPCWWWEKQNKHLLDYCNQRYVCHFYGFSSYQNCANECLN